MQKIAGKIKRQAKEKCDNLFSAGERVKISLELFIDAVWKNQKTEKKRKEIAEQENKTKKVQNKPMIRGKRTKKKQCSILIITIITHAFAYSHKMSGGDY